jgi:hypothetical protein
MKLRSILAAAAALALASSAHAQAGGDARAVLRATAARLWPDSVRSYTLTFRSLGEKVPVYARRGQNGFAYESVASDTSGPGALAALSEALFTAVSMLPQDETGAVHDEGVRQRNGVPMRVISAEADGDRMEVEIDTATRLPGRMYVHAQGQESSGGEFEVLYSDWRTVNGMPVACQRHFVAHGLRAEVMGADTAAMARTLATVRAGIDRVPADRREMTKQFLTIMDDLLHRDELVLDVAVTDVAVNGPPPPGRLVPLEF